MQQRQQGRDLRGDPRRQLHARSARSRRAPRPAPAAAAACRWSRRSSKAELKSAGVAVNNHLCEHFALHAPGAVPARQASTSIKTFDDAARAARPGPRLRDLQAGGGLDPGHRAGTSTSCGREHAPLQDTNDRFLANIQRDGTYSVVPRVPGGEITPDKLIALGAGRARSTASTPRSPAASASTCSARASSSCRGSGSELVAAGFESGHAYGKALRTVKSCVGTTWCRYGVQDSVGFAIRVENRYKGLRAPHKLKIGGVGLHARVRRGAEQGLRRHRHREGLEPLRLRQRRHEAAARRSARVRPRRRDADPLHRPLPDVLHPHRRPAAAHRTLAREARRRPRLPAQVVIDDTLGIGAELEADMQHLVDTYECEWKAAVDDPETLQALPPLRQQRRARPQRRVRRRARPDPARAAASEREDERD